jgi:polysaccharide deacetylase 2 family uncharacterized protein YibQ
MGRQRTSPLGRSISLRNPLFWIVVIILFLVGLDFVGWSTGGKSFLFSLILGERFAPPGPEEVVLIVRQEMSRQKIPLQGLHRFTDSGGNLHLKVDLQPEEYNRLAPALEKSLQAAKSAVLGKQEEKDKISAYYLWELKTKKKLKALILFSCGGERLLARRRPRPGVETRLVQGPVRVALILDDLGYSLEKARAVCELNLPLAVSILPFSPFDVESAQIAHEHGLEVLLHLPMESKNRHDTEKFTRGLIEARLTEEEVRKRVREDLYQVPYIRGVNNHMGSLLTEDAAKMETVLGVIREFGLFFIDSRTSLDSKAYETARRLHIPAASSDLFLDAAEETPDKVEQNLRQLFSLARERGWAVGICHPYEGTLEALRDLPALLEKSGVVLVPPSQIAGTNFLVR